MTSIGEQRDSDLITDGLVLIKTCRQRRRPLPSPPLPSPASAAQFHRQSHHSVVSPLLSAKKGLICSSMESWDLTFFSSLVFFFCSFCSFFLFEQHYLQAPFTVCVFARFHHLDARARGASPISQTDL